jgi:hypothetical protein
VRALLITLTVRVALKTVVGRALVTRLEATLGSVLSLLDPFGARLAGATTSGKMPGHFADAGAALPLVSIRAAPRVK